LVVRTQGPQPKDLELHVEDAAELLGFEVDSDAEGVDTIAGLIAKRLGKVALPGASVTEHGWRLTAEQSAGRRNRVMTILAEPAEPAPRRPSGPGPAPREQEARA